jgi:hypothetical protein
LNKVIITYMDCKGSKEKVEVNGDFEIGREKTEEGPKLTFSLSTGEVYHVTDCPLTISRLVKVGSKECASCHARIFWEGDRLFIQDMGSTNGTTMDGQPLRGWEKKKRSDNVEIDKTSNIKLGEFELIIEPIIPKEEPSPILKQLGLDPVLAGAKQNGSSPIIINIQKLEAGSYKNIGSIDVTANRSNVGIDADNDDDDEPNGRRNHRDVDVVASRNRRSPDRDEQDEPDRRRRKSRKKYYEDLLEQ